MNFTVRVSNRAQKSLKGIPAADRRRVIAALADMAADPLAGDVVKLVGTDTFRRRVGKYRIVFGIDFRQSVVGIIDVLRRTTTTYR
jgi:mRNA interferase RelE/StbE